MRFSSSPPVHHCEFETVRTPELTQTSIERWAGLSIKQRAQAEVASFIALFDAPLEIVEDRAFHRLSDALVDIGREDRPFHFGRGRCPLARGSHIFRGISPGRAPRQRDKIRTFINWG
jgi:hypothetical protein